MSLRILVLLSLIAAVPRSGDAQAVELAPFVAYRVGGGFEDLQGRDYNVNDNGDAGAFCTAPGGCSLAFAGNLFFQADLAAGAIIRLGSSRNRGP